MAVTDELIDEWARSRNGVITGPELIPGGRHGNRGNWPVLGSYRRLLVALRLRSESITEVHELRLLLWASGYGGAESEIVHDLTRSYRKRLKSARREMNLPPEGPARRRPPLRLRRGVQRALAEFTPGALLPECSPTEAERVGQLARDPLAVPFATALVDLMFRGPRPDILQGLADAARSLPVNLGRDDITVATAGSAGALTHDDSNVVIEALERANVTDIRTAAAMLGWLPLYFGWAQRVLGEDDGDPEARFLAQLSGVSVQVFSRMSAERRLVGLAMLAAHYARYRDGLVTWAPGVST